MQRPGGSVSGHMGSRCVHRFRDGFGLKWPEMDTARSVISRRHHPRKRMIRYSRAVVMESRSRGVPDTPLEPVIGLAEGETRWRGMTAEAPACFPLLLAPNKRLEIGGGRATRQPGQVRKEAALTRSGSGRSSVSYLFFERIAQDGLPLPALGFAALFRKPASRDNQVRIDR